MIVFLSVLVWLAFIFLTYRRAPQPWIRYLPMVGGVLALVPLMIENMEEGVFSTTEYSLIVTSILLLVASLIFLRRNRQRALWGICSALVVLMLTLMLPVMAARSALPGQLAEIPTVTAGSTPSMSDVALDVYNQVLEIVSDETGLSTDVISERLDSGESSVAQMVREADGDLSTVVQGITDVMTVAIQNLVARDQMDENEAAFAISAMHTVVRAGVEFDLTGLMSRFEETE